MNIPDIPSIFNRFATGETLEDYAPFGSGHIHRTWVIRTTGSDRPDFVLQNINHKVFPPVDGMMENIRKVTAHIRKKMIASGTESLAGRVLEVIPTRDGKTHFTDSEGCHWRLYPKVEPGISYDVVPSEQVACEAGRAFGRFIADLQDFPADELVTVIPAFHSVEWRYEQLSAAVERDAEGRLEEVGPEVAFAREQVGRMRTVSQQEREGRLPVRVTHNDTKLNNILFDENDRAMCVIDLDTVMPGLTLYDFGDLIRTAANTAEEDEADLERVQFSLPVFGAITRGFLESTGQMLTPDEADMLALGGPYMTWLMGIRFLADYLNGDTYYHIHDPEQNLRRCRAQFRLIERMQERESECRELIQRWYTV